METVVKISKSQHELAWDFAAELAEMINNAASQKKTLTIALSGGTTPRLLFSILGTHFTDRVNWSYVHFFWGDERCVPPGHEQSNFGMTNDVFLQKISIPPENVHRIRGEDDPGEEASRYAQEILSVTIQRDKLPVFDLILLGLGEDGHTASIFPGNRQLIDTDKVCETAIHPASGQRRISLTAPVINNAGCIIFLVTGISKASVVSEIIERPGIAAYPAALIEPSHGAVKWYLDVDAASMLSQWA